MAGEPGGTAGLRPVLDVHGMNAALTDPDGRAFLGSAPRDGISLTPGETHLPFVLQAASTDGGTEAAGERARQMALNWHPRAGVRINPGRGLRSVPGYCPRDGVGAAEV